LEVGGLEVGVEGEVCEVRLESESPKAKGIRGLVGLWRERKTHGLAVESLSGKYVQSTDSSGQKSDRITKSSGKESKKT
jgi:hypothetical protein